MKIALTTPFSVGDLSPSANYPHVYITTFYVNGPARSAQVTYEVGELRDVSDGNPMGTWTKAAEVPTSTVQLQGDELVPFFGALVSCDESASPALWDQVEQLLYGLIQARDPRMQGALS